MGRKPISGRNEGKGDIPFFLFKKKSCKISFIAKKKPSCLPSHRTKGPQRCLTSRNGKDLGKSSFHVKKRDRFRAVVRDRSRKRSGRPLDPASQKNGGESERKKRIRPHGRNRQNQREKKLSLVDAIAGEKPIFIAKELRPTLNPGAERVPAADVKQHKRI